jgi:hypothetical protein
MPLGCRETLSFNAEPAGDGTHGDGTHGNDPLGIQPSPSGSALNEAPTIRPRPVLLAVWIANGHTEVQMAG